MKMIVGQFCNNYLKIIIILNAMINNNEWVAIFRKQLLKISAFSPEKYFIQADFPNTIQ